jgi:hypothetical protein
MGVGEQATATELTVGVTGWLSLAPPPPPQLVTGKTPKNEPRESRRIAACRFMGSLFKTGFSITASIFACCAEAGPAPLEGIDNSNRQNNPKYQESSTFPRYRKVAICEALNIAIRSLQAGTNDRTANRQRVTV